MREAGATTDQVQVDTTIAWITGIVVLRSQ
jgi:hypothetical protein